MKNINFVPKDVQRILSSDKISEKYNEQKVFFNKNKRPTTLSKKRLQRMCFLGNIAKFL